VSVDPRASFPLGNTLAGGRYVIEQRLFGDRFRGLYTGTDAEGGARVLVTVARAQTRDLHEVADALRLDFPGVTPLLHVGVVSRTSGMEDYDGIVEAAPAGRPVSELALPQSPRAALGLAASLADVAARVHAGDELLEEIRPQLVFVNEAAELVAMTPRCARFVAGAAKGNVQLPPLFPDSCWAPEVLEGDPPGPDSDVFAIGLLLARLVTGAYPFEGDDLAQQTNAVATGRRRPFSGPAAIAELVDAALDPQPARRPSAVALRHAATITRDLLAN
jgi:hypothetical protein